MARTQLGTSSASSSESVQASREVRSSHILVKLITRVMEDTGFICGSPTANPSSPPYSTPKWRSLSFAGTLAEWSLLLSIRCLLVSN